MDDIDKKDCPGMDAIDALLCFGFKLVRTNQCYHLNNHSIDARYYYQVRELFQEIGQAPEYHRALFTKKGVALGL